MIRKDSPETFLAIFQGLFRQLTLRDVTDDATIKDFFCFH